MPEVDLTRRFDLNSITPSQTGKKAPDRRPEENPEIDREADVPKDRAERRPVAEIGEDIGNPHDQEQNASSLTRSAGWREIPPGSTARAKNTERFRSR